MDYYQKYIKYKSKYFALKQIAGGKKGPDAIEKLTGIAIPPELQALNNAFLPGFNIDSQYVDELLKYSREAIQQLLENGGDTQPHCKSIINKLIELNNNKNGLCETGDRNNKKPVPKAIINSNLKDNNTQNIDNQIQALTFFKTVDKIRDFPVEKIAKSIDNQIIKFQECNDYFIPEFNIDKAYVGHLLYYALSMKNKTDVSSVYAKLKALNDKLKFGINNLGDRLLVGKQKKLKKIDIKFPENPNKNFHMNFEGNNIAVTNPSLFISPNIN